MQFKDTFKRIFSFLIENVIEDYNYCNFLQKIPVKIPVKVKQTFIQI